MRLFSHNDAVRVTPPNSAWYDRLKMNDSWKSSDDERAWSLTPSKLDTLKEHIPTTLAVIGILTLFLFAYLFRG